MTVNKSSWQTPDLPCVFAGEERHRAAAPSAEFYTLARAPAAESSDAQGQAPAALKPTADILFMLSARKAVLSKDGLELAGVSSVVQSLAQKSVTRVYQTSASSLCLHPWSPPEPQAKNKMRPALKAS